MIDKARGAVLPPYGSEAWLTLPDGDPVKVAAVVVAAEAWAQSGDTLADDLRAEAYARRASEKAAEDAEYAEAQRAHRERWAPVARSTVVPFAKRRRRQLEAAGPRPGDHPGGAVAPW
ncbi:UNVERIFIED_CONTAM: hypothetical protein LK11_00785 [Mumia flava]|nr:DUF2742 domain-containing protein [Mumia flava]